MAGYIMTINDAESIQKCVETGTYSTIFHEAKDSKWNAAQEGTFADYLSMREGDSIYFFHKRKIYGIGKIVNMNDDCKFLNYIEADIPNNISNYEYQTRVPLLEYANQNNRCFCTFIPEPYFFMNGIDMDDVLSSNPDKFRIFRTMWKVSFLKIDVEENKALRDIILKRNEDNLISKKEILPFKSYYHQQIYNKIEQGHRLRSYQILLAAADRKKLKHEMAIEAALCEKLGTENDSPFGKWDYISHQVAASPFKPIDYMDKMDVFGYRYIQGYDTISKYLVIEIKKDKATSDVIEQIMKYVDWLNQEYAHGDYSMIEAYIVAADFPKDLMDLKNEKCVRNFTKGYRPTQACKWDDVKFVKYEYDLETGDIFFEIKKLDPNEDL